MLGQESSHWDCVVLVLKSSQAVAPAIAFMLPTLIVLSLILSLGLSLILRIILSLKKKLYVGTLPT